MIEYKILHEERASTLEELMNEAAKQGYTLEKFAVGPSPYSNYEGDITGTQSEAWVVMSREVPMPMSVVRQREEGRG